MSNCNWLRYSTNNLQMFYCELLVVTTQMFPGNCIYFFCHSHNTQNEKVKKKLWMCQFVLFWYSMKKQYKHKACAVPFVAVHWTHTSTIKLEYCFERTSPLTYGNCLTLQSVLWEHMKLRLHCHWEFHKNYDFFKRIAMASRLIKATHTIRTISQVIIYFGPKIYP